MADERNPPPQTRTSRRNRRRDPAEHQPFTIKEEISLKEYAEDIESWRDYKGIENELHEIVEKRRGWGFVKTNAKNIRELIGWIGVVGAALIVVYQFLIAHIGIVK